MQHLPEDVLALASCCQRQICPGAGLAITLGQPRQRAVRCALILRSLPRWQHLAGLFKRHPSLREELTAGIFWRDTHALLLLAISGAIAARKQPAAALLIAPWALKAAPQYGPGLRGRLRAATELPGRAVVDLAEIAVLARGSVRYRTILL